jgi:hypothetical protein
MSDERYVQSSFVHGEFVAAMKTVGVVSFFFELVNLSGSGFEYIARVGSRTVVG